METWVGEFIWIETRKRERGNGRGVNEKSEESAININKLIKHLGKSLIVDR